MAVTYPGNVTFLGIEARMFVNIVGEAEEQVGYGEATLTADRSVTAVARSSEWTDYQRPGKVKINGSIRRLLIDGKRWQMLLGMPQDSAGLLQTLGDPVTNGGLFDLKLSGSHEGHGFIAECKNCFFVGNEIALPDSDQFIEEPMGWEMMDASNDFKFGWTTV